MKYNVLSLRQMMVLLAVALLAPVTDLLPVVAARQAGSGGWLIALTMLPILLAAAWACRRAFCGGVVREAGRPLRYTIIIMYILWCTATLAVVLRVGAIRMEMVSGGVPSVVFTLSLTAVAVWMGLGKVSALARGAEIFFLALAAATAGILALAVGDVEWRNLQPIVWSELPGAGIRAAGVILAAAPLSVLGKDIPEKQLRLPRMWGWITAFCAVVTLLLIAVIGTMGNRLCAELEIPYIIMVQGLGVKGAFQRMEAMVSALWLVSDLVFAGALLCAIQEYAVQLAPKKRVRWLCPVAAAAAVMLPWVLPQLSGKGVQRLFSVLSGTGIVLGLIVPLFLAVVSLFGQKRAE